MIRQEIEGVLAPPNEGNLPLNIERNPETNRITSIRIAWQGFSIRQQFPWTRPIGPNL